MTKAWELRLLRHKQEKIIHDSLTLGDKLKIQKARLCHLYLVQSVLKLLIDNEDIELAFVEVQIEVVGHIERQPVVAEAPENLKKKYFFKKLVKLGVKIFDQFLKNKTREIEH